MDTLAPFVKRIKLCLCLKHCSGLHRADAWPSNTSKASKLDLQMSAVRLKFCAHSTYLDRLGANSLSLRRPSASGLELESKNACCAIQRPFLGEGMQGVASRLLGFGEPPLYSKSDQDLQLLSDEIVDGVSTHLRVSSAAISHTKVLQ